MVPGLLKRQNIYYDNDGDDGDDREYWGYSDVSVDAEGLQCLWTKYRIDRSGHQMGFCGRYNISLPTMVYWRLLPCSTED